MFPKWVSLEPHWSLQDVQAALNVCIAIISAGALFTLVRYCWMLAARRVAKNHNIPAHSLLSLNTIGEVIDVIWLLRYDLFTTRYQGLLLQTVFVILLTISTLLSGFIARWSTRYGSITQEMEVSGALAKSNVKSIPQAEWDTNITMSRLINASFPQTELLDFLPDEKYDWKYKPGQWNASWIMDCTYTPLTSINNPVASTDCSNGYVSQLPFFEEKWADYRKKTTARIFWDSTGWRNNGTIYRDWIIFSTGVDTVDYDKVKDRYNGLSLRTMYHHMMWLPLNKTGDCSFTGKLGSAEYTAMDCKLTRKIGGGRSDEDIDNWGPYPEGTDMDWLAKAYLQHYGNRFRKESMRERDVTPVNGTELAMFYQAYMATKDTTMNFPVKRLIDTTIRVPQVSLICLIVLGAALAIVLFGLTNYWIFVIRNWHKLHATPQSKLDWMLKTLRQEDGVPPSENADRKRLSSALAVDTKDEAVPLTRLDDSRMSIKSGVSAVSHSTPAQDSLDTPILSSNFSTPAMNNSTWFPQQYQRVPAQNWNSPVPNFDYNTTPQQQSQYGWQGNGHMDTAYDPHRR